MSKPRPLDLPALRFAVVLDRHGTELATAPAVEIATRLSRAYPDALCVVGLYDDGSTRLLARCSRGLATPSELRCTAAVRRWRTTRELTEHRTNVDPRPSRMRVEGCRGNEG